MLLSFTYTFQSESTLYGCLNVEELPEGISEVQVTATGAISEVQVTATAKWLSVRL